MLLLLLLLVPTLIPARRKTPRLQRQPDVDSDKITYTYSYTISQQDKCVGHKTLRESSVPRRRERERGEYVGRNVYRGKRV